MKIIICKHLYFETTKVTNKKPLEYRIEAIIPSKTRVKKAGKFTLKKLFYFMFDYIKSEHLKKNIYKMGQKKFLYFILLSI